MLAIVVILPMKSKEKFGYWLQVQLRKKTNNNELKLINKRCIVERTFAWLGNDRRLCRNYELVMEIAEEMV